MISSFSFTEYSGAKFTQGVVFKKSLGQNFIFDEGFLESIVRELALCKDDIVVEVGTGAGTLTRVLARKVKQVITYEIDRSLEPVLQKQFEDFNNIELHFADAMKIKDFPSEFKVVANIPYYITTPLILKFLAIDACKEICVLIQDEVASRIVAKPGGKEYGALSVTMQAQAECKIIRRVPRSLFKPVPNVDSAFVTIKKFSASRIDCRGTGIFNQLVKGCFASRRKTMLNALKNSFGLDTQTARNILSECGIDESIRPENISVDKYIELSRKLMR